MGRIVHAQDGILLQGELFENELLPLGDVGHEFPLIIARDNAQHLHCKIGVGSPAKMGTALGK